MTTKERKKLARKIADQERIILTSQDPHEVSEAKLEEMRLSEYLDWDDIDAVDVLVQEYLSEYKLA
jgi:hypothetical protein